MKTHDYTDSWWGHALNIVREDGLTMYAIGHCQERIQVGDFVRLRFQSGATRLVRVDVVEFFTDPMDMFTATLSKGEWSMTDEERQAQAARGEK